MVEGLVLLLPLAYVVSRYDRTWFFYDEWSVIGHNLHAPVGELFNLNGHLWLFPALVYRAQAQVGLTGHWLVYGVFCASLLAFSLSLRWLLMRLGVTSTLATVGAVAVVHAGFASQNNAFEVQLAGNTAFALGFAGVAALLGSSHREGVAGAVLLLLAVGWDSATVLLVLLFAGPLLLVCRGWKAWLPLLPAALATGAWHALAARGPSYPEDARTRARFAASLLSRSLGGLVGGEVLAGAAVLAAAAVTLLVRQRSLPRRSAGALAAAVVATTATVAVLVQTRAGVAYGHHVDFNRYLGQVATFALLGLLPLAAERARAELAVGGALLVGLVLGAGTMRDYRQGFEAYNQQTRDGVAVLVGQLRAGCAPPPDTQPLGAVGPQVTVALVAELLERGVELPETAATCASAP